MTRTSAAKRINFFPRVFERKFNPAWMKLDNQAVRSAMVTGVGDYFRGARKKKAIIGLSGGLDSAVASQIAVESLGRKNVFAAALPYHYGKSGTVEDTKDWQDAHLVAKHLGINFETRNITGAVNAAARELGIDPSSRSLSAEDINRLGNIKARQRMIMLMDISARENGLVIGTGNRSEIVIGYCTLFGDTACAIDPLAEIYKTQEFEFARFMGVLQRIIDRIPSAGLFDGQTDEGQFGFKYSELDPLSFLMLDHGLSADQLVKFGFTRRFIMKVDRMHQQNAFKFRMPAVVSLPKPEVEIKI